MGLTSLIIGLRGLVLIPLSILVLGAVATVLIFVGVNERYVNGPIARMWARTVLWLAGTRVEVRGLETIPSGGESFIVVMNHQSNMDIPVLVHSLPLQLRFIGKIELYKVPIFGRALVKAGHFLIDRKNHEMAMRGLREAGHAVRRKGVSIVFAPEGTRSSDGKLLPFKKGAFVMAIECGLPLLPVVIDGTAISMPRGSLWARQTCVIVTIHPPIPTEGLDYNDRDSFSEQVRGIMEETLRQREGNGD